MSFRIYIESIEISLCFKDLPRNDVEMIRIPCQIPPSKENYHKPSSMSLIIHSVVCRIGEQSLRAAKLHFIPTFKFTSHLFPLNTGLQQLAFLLLILPLLLALTSFHCFEYPYFASLLFIFVTPTLSYPKS